MRLIPVGPRHVALVDDEDFARLSTFSWALAKGYARRRWHVSGRRYAEPMHRTILGDRPGLFPDHVNGDKLDNRRCNLRWATNQQNRFNTPVRRGKASCPYKGVTVQSCRAMVNPYRRPWCARIKVDGRLIRLGCFETAEEAARAYDQSAVAHYGEFARTNFPHHQIS